MNFPKKNSDFLLNIQNWNKNIKTEEQTPQTNKKSQKKEAKTLTKEEQNNKTPPISLEENEPKAEKNWKMYRKGAGLVWQDESLNDWPDNDYRIFVGDLGNEVTDQVLLNAFSKYKSLFKVKVVRNSFTGKTKGYGFVSILDVNDYIKAMKEMDGKYIGNRPCKLSKSTWKDRSLKYNKSKIKSENFIKKKRKNSN